MEERLKFIARLLDGEKMAAVCRDFNISRKTGHKLLQRYRDSGLHGLTDRSRRPYRQANQLPMQTERLIVRLKKDYPNWGAPKIQERLRRLHPDIHCPPVSTVHAVLDRNGLVKRRTRRRNRAAGTPLSHTRQPNGLWCADYKGELMLADRRYCYPLTITDYASRYLVACEALHTTKEVYAFGVFERAFKDFGLPAAIRTDNGVPFASPNALFNLSKLSVWWLRLGIAIERIKPGNPQQNGRHERMHLTLKLETTKPAGANFLEQQGKFDDFIEVFNTERPHQALAMAVPADHYQPSQRQYQGLPDIHYPFHDKAVTVTTCGRICFNRRKINLSQAFAGQTVGIKQIHRRVAGFYSAVDRCWMNSQGGRFRKAGAALAKSSTMEHVAASELGRSGVQVGRSVRLASGRFAILQKGKQFALVPWQQAMRMRKGMGLGVESGKGLSP